MFIVFVLGSVLLHFINENSLLGVFILGLIVFVLLRSTFLMCAFLTLPLLILAVIRLGLEDLGWIKKDNFEDL
jgi:hypothetical protein